MKKPTLTPVPSGAGEGNDASAEAQFFASITIDVLARTIWGEARGEGTSGMSAVACVVINRVKIAQEKRRVLVGG